MQKIWALAFLVLTVVSGYLGYQYLTSQSELTSALVYPAPRNLSEFSLMRLGASSCKGNGLWHLWVTPIARTFAR